MKKNIAMSSMTWFLGIGQLIGGLLCQKYGGKVVFEISNLSLGLLNCIIPVAADINVEAVIIIRILQGILGVSLIFQLVRIIYYLYNKK